MPFTFPLTSRDTANIGCQTHTKIELNTRNRATSNKDTQFPVPFRENALWV